MKLIAYCDKCMNWFKISSLFPFGLGNKRNKICRYCSNELYIKKWTDQFEITFFIRIKSIKFTTIKDI